jgi:hypothetical protein
MEPVNRQHSSPSREQIMQLIPRLLVAYHPAFWSHTRKRASELGVVPAAPLLPAAGMLWESVSLEVLPSIVDCACPGAAPPGATGCSRTFGGVGSSASCGVNGARVALSAPEAGADG